MNRGASKKPRKIRHFIRLAQLELLAAMRHTSTLSAAARMSGLAQPTASRLLRELAEGAGVQLFEKFGRTLRPTPSGQLALQKASRLVAELDRLQEELEAVDKGLLGTVALGAGVAPCFVLVPLAIDHLMRGPGKVSVSLREGGMEELIDKLREGQIDLLIGRIEQSKRHHDLELEELYDPPMRIVCGRGHPLSRKRKVTLKEAIAGPWLLPEPMTAMRRGVEGLFQVTKVWPTECLVESSIIQTNVALLNASNVIWVLSADIAAYYEKLGELKILPAPQLRGPGPVLMASLRSRSVSAPVARLRESLRIAARNLTQTMQAVKKR